MQINKLCLIYGFSHIILFKLPKYICVDIINSRTISLLALTHAVCYIFINKLIKLKKINIYKSTGFLLKNI